MAKFMSSLLLVCLLIGTLGIPVGAVAPFGEDVPELSQSAMDEVEGEFSPFVYGAAFGAIGGTVNYLVTTPRSSWSLQGWGRTALSGAICGTLGVFSGRFTSW